MPSVAGKNARRPNPVRTDWRGKHGLTSPEGPLTQGIGVSPNADEHIAKSIHIPGLDSSCDSGPSSATTAYSSSPSSATVPAKVLPDKEKRATEEDEATPKLNASITQNTAEMTTKDARVFTPNLAKPSAPNKSTGGILLIAQNLRELATAAVMARFGYAESQAQQVPSSLQSEQLRGLRDQVVQVAATEVDGKMTCNTQPLMLTKAQTAWCEQRSKVVGLTFGELKDIN